MIATIDDTKILYSEELGVEISNDMMYYNIVPVEFVGYEAENTSSLQKEVRIYLCNQTIVINMFGDELFEKFKAEMKKMLKRSKVL